MRKLILAAALAAIPLAGCAGGVATNLTTVTAAQITTLTDAELATTLVAKATDAFVQTGTASKPALQQIAALTGAVATALTALETAQTKGQSLDFTAFNAALSAFQTYQSTINASK